MVARASRVLARAGRVAAGVGLALALVGGCKAAVRGGHVEVADDIDAIERALAERGAELEQAGVVVAYRDVPEPTPTAPMHEEQLGDTDEAGPGVEPVTPAPNTDVPAEPTPSPTEPSPTEQGNADSPALSSKAVDLERDQESMRERRRSKRSVRQATSDEGARCERLWGLAESTCGLSARVCALSGRHFGDIRYAVACRRAEDQCAAARELCESCPTD